MFPGLYLYYTVPAQHCITAGSDVSELSELSGLGVRGVDLGAITPFSLYQQTQDDDVAIISDFSLFQTQDDVVNSTHIGQM